MKQQKLVETLRHHGVRPTQQRVAVYDYLLRHCTHPSAEEVYLALVKENPTFSRTTVYNSLHALVEASLVRELPLDAEERHYDADVAPHAHFLCHGCRRIADIPLDPAIAQALQPDGYVIETREITLSGVCPTCSQSGCA